MDSRIEGILDESRHFRETVVQLIHSEIAEACGKAAPRVQPYEPQTHIIGVAAKDGAIRIGRNQYRHGQLILTFDNNP